MPPKSQTLSFSVKRFKVDREAGTLSDVVLLSGDRSAKGHGIYIDAKTVQTALASVTEEGGVLKAYVAHQTWEEQWEGKDRILDVPGFFSDLSIRGGDLVAARFEFFESFREADPAAYARLMEMAEKTPSLFGMSIEAMGYLVYVDATSGEEYSDKPENVELAFSGWPVFRVSELTAAAFVSDPAATDGLFAAALRRLRGGDSRADLAAILTALQASIQSQPTITPTPPVKFQTDPTMLEKLILALKQKYAADPARLSRALLAATELTLAPEDDAAARAAEVEAALAAEDTATELTELRAKATAADAAEARATAAEARLTAMKDSGHVGRVGTGAPSITGLESKIGHTKRALAMLQEQGLIGANFAITGISDLWLPSVWIDGMAETLPIGTSFMGSSVVVSSPELNAAAIGGGSTINVPFFQEPDQADALQVENTGVTPGAIGSGTQIAARLNRRVDIGATALAGGLSGSDPIGYAIGVIGTLRRRNQQRSLFSTLAGLFGTAWASLSKDVATLETGATPASTKLFDGDFFADATGLLGERRALVSGGAMVVHPDIESAMIKQDDIEFIRPSEGVISMPFYKGRIPVYTMKELKRAGTTSGFVYDSYLFAPATVGTGYKPQSNMTGDTSALLIDEDKDKNNVIVRDFTSGYIHPNFAKWTGTAANASGGPTNVELATAGNWASAAADLENVGIVRMRTNG